MTLRWEDSYGGHAVVAKGTKGTWSNLIKATKYFFFNGGAWDKDSQAKITLIYNNVLNKDVPNLQIRDPDDKKTSHLVM